MRTVDDDDDEEEKRHKVNKCSVITYIAFVSLYTLALMLASRRVGGANNSSNNHGIDQTAENRDGVGPNNALFLIHLSGLIVLLGPPIFFIWIGMRDSKKKVFPETENNINPHSNPAITSA